MHSKLLENSLIILLAPLDIWSASVLSVELFRVRGARSLVLSCASHLTVYVLLITHRVLGLYSCVSAMNSAGCRNVSTRMMLHKPTVRGAKDAPKRDVLKSVRKLDGNASHARRASCRAMEAHTTVPPCECKAEVRSPPAISQRHANCWATETVHKRDVNFAILLLMHPPLPLLWYAACLQVVK